MTYYDYYWKLVMEEDGVQFWNELEIFWNEIHKDIQIEENVEGHKFSMTLKEVITFEEEVYWLLADLHLHYSYKVIQEKIPNLSFFENLMSKWAEQTERISVLHSCAWKYYINK